MGCFWDISGTIKTKSEKDGQDVDRVLRSILAERRFAYTSSVSEYGTVEFSYEGDNFSSLLDDLIAELEEKASNLIADAVVDSENDKGAHSRHLWKNGRFEAYDGEIRLCYKGLDHFKGSIVFSKENTAAVNRIIANQINLVGTYQADDADDTLLTYRFTCDTEENSFETHFLLPLVPYLTKGTVRMWKGGDEFEKTPSDFELLDLGTDRLWIRRDLRLVCDMRDLLSKAEWAYLLGLLMDARTDGAEKILKEYFFKLPPIVGNKDKDGSSGKEGKTENS